MGLARKGGVTGIAVSLAMLSLAATAWACVAGPTLLVSPQNVAAGDRAQITGGSYDKSAPVIVSLGALDGPVLGELVVDDDGRIAGEVTIPTSTAPGNFVLVSTQPATDGRPEVALTRALVTVVGPGGAPTANAPPAATPAGTPAARSATPSGTEAPTGGSLVLAGVGIAGVVLFLAGIAVVMSGRSEPSTEAARAT